MNRLDLELSQRRNQLGSFFALREPPDFTANAANETAGRVTATTTLRRSATTPIIFDYQDDLIKQVVSRFPEGFEGLLSLPTGGGKTRTAVVSCLEGLAQGFLFRVVWLAPTRELVDQAIETFVAMWHDFGSAPDVQLGVPDSEYDPNEERSDLPQVWITTVQSVYAKLTRQQLVGRWDAVYFDEAHQMPARTFGAAVRGLRSGDALTCKEGRRSSLIGLSATPGRTEEGGTKSLAKAFGNNLLTSKILGKNPVLTLQRRGILSRLEFKKFTTREISEEDVVARLRVAITACEVLVRRGSHILVFAAAVADAIAMAEALNGLEIPAASVHSQMPMRARTAVLDAFRRSECSVVTNQRLLATGYDCPAVSDVMLLSKIGSPILFEQMVGRAARGPRTGGSAVARVWQFEDHLAIHGLPSSYYRYRDYDWSG